MLRKLVLLSLLLITAQDLWAKRLMNPYPASLATNQQDFIFNTVDPTEAEVVLLYNKSAKTLWLNRVLGDNPGVSAGWSSQLDANHWSALSWMGSFTLSCQQLSDQLLQDIPCSQVLQLYKPVSGKKMAQGSYWVVENKTKSVLISTLIKEMVL